MVLNSNTLSMLWKPYLVWTTSVGGHVAVSRSDCFSVIKQKYIVYVGALSRSQANTDDRQANRACHRQL